MINLDCLHKGRDEQTNHLKSSLHQLHEHFFFKLLSVPKPRSQCFEITRRVDILLMEEILQELYTAIVYQACSTDYIYIWPSLVLYIPKLYKSSCINS